MAGYTQNTKAPQRSKFRRSDDRHPMNRRIAALLVFVIASSTITFLYLNRNITDAPHLEPERKGAGDDPGAIPKLSANRIQPRKPSEREMESPDKFDRTTDSATGSSPQAKARTYLFEGGALNAERVEQLSNDETFDLLYNDLVRSSDSEHLELGRQYSSQLAEALSKSGQNQQLERLACASQVCLGEVRSASPDASTLLVELAALSESGKMPIGAMSFVETGFDRPNAGRIRVVFSNTLISVTARPAPR